VPETDPALRRVERDSVIACAAQAVVAGLLTGRTDAMAGVIAGGGLVAISYRGIKAGISALVDAAGGGTGRSVVVGLVKFFTRYAILAVAAYVIMARLRLPPVAVFAGASSIVIAVMFEALRGVSHSGTAARLPGRGPRSGR
jgi:hypothetical protein